MSILIVDDNITLAEELCASLEALYPCVVHTQSLCAAEKLVKQREFSVILLDYNLGPVTGVELLIRCKEALKCSNVVLMTGYATKELAIQAVNLGINKFIEKPFKVDDLIKLFSTHNDGLEFHMDESSLEVQFKGVTVQLTEIEFLILSLLVRERNKVVCKKALFKHVYGNEVKARNALHCHLTNLKSKMPKAFTGALKNVRGKGYILTASP